MARREPADQHPPAKRPVKLEEVQTDLMRLESRVSNRLEDAFSGLESSQDPGHRSAAIRRRLAYTTAALDIAVAPNPELNLFDMISFLEISRSVLERYWIPKVFGADEGQPALDAFEVSIAEAWKIAKNVISPRKREELSLFIAHWIEGHPEHRSVETLRFSRFAESMRSEVLDSDIRGVRRLIQHANRALETADASRLLAERAFYYAQRAPFLIRLQARIAAHELITEVDLAIRATPAAKSLLQARDTARSFLRAIWAGISSGRWKAG